MVGRLSADKAAVGQAGAGGTRGLHLQADVHKAILLLGTVIEALGPEGHPEEHNDAKQQAEQRPLYWAS